MADAERCRVFWGSHGCELERGHKGAHQCDPGCPPVGYGKWWRIFGEDIPWYLKLWKWLTMYPYPHRRVWWRLSHRLLCWPEGTIGSWERHYGVPWPYEKPRRSWIQRVLRA